MPRINRTTNIEAKPIARPPSAVAIDHATMYANRLLRRPKRSANQPDGTWHNAYEKKKALYVWLTMSSDRFNSVRISGNLSTSEMKIRWTYRMTDAAVVAARIW